MIYVIYRWGEGRVEVEGAGVLRPELLQHICIYVLHDIFISMNMRIYLYVDIYMYYTCM